MERPAAWPGGAHPRKSGVIQEWWMKIEKKTTCPYGSMPDSAYWSRSVARPQAADIDPFIGKPPKITKTAKLATMGSCFAQHIARYLSNSGYNYFVTEDCPKLVPAEVRSKFNFGTFSARYGNIYTSLQLVQLFDRVYGKFTPVEEYWKDGNAYFDPFRPQINPNGYASVAELRRDRQQHFAAVRRIFEEADFLVFTMGLTEVWTHVQDNSAYPVCPGCGAGTFDAKKYVFNNLGYLEVYSQMNEFLGRLKSVNPSVKVILTVSPVPLVATGSGDHVLTATTYSKAVLRAVAGDLANSHANITYFPSYEIITGSYARGAYFETDLRGVKEEGVRQVMRTFFRHFTDGPLPAAVQPMGPAQAAPPAQAAAPQAAAAHAVPALTAEESLSAEEARAAMQVCDEEILEKM
jgi:hypothetical protein